MDTTPSPRSSSQDVTMKESGTQDSGGTGYSQADSAASQAVGDRSSSHAGVKVSVAVRFLRSTVQEKQYEVRILEDVVEVFLPGRIKDEEVVFKADCPENSEERGKLIAAMSGSLRTVIKLTLNLSHFFEFIDSKSKSKFLHLRELVLCVDDPCEHELESLPGDPPKFAPALERLEIQKYHKHRSRTTPQDVTEWGVEHGVPLIAMLFKRLTRPSLNVIFNHTTSDLLKGQTRGVTPIKEALEQEGISCSLKVINIETGVHTEETCNLMGDRLRIVGARNVL